MIFRHLFKTTGVSQPARLPFRNIRTFSSVDDENEGNDNNQGQTEELHPQEAAELSGEELQESEEGFTKLRHKNQRSNFREEKPDPQLTPFINSFLGVKKPQIDLNLFEEATGEDLHQKFEEITEKLLTEAYAPFAEYQKKLNLTVDSFSKFKAATPQKSKAALLKYSKLGGYSNNPLLITKMLISSQQFSELKNLYEGQFFKNTFSFEVCQTIAENVLLYPEYGFLLNILYQNIQAPKYSSKSPVVISRLQQLIELVRFGDARQANPLKFYWFSITNSPTLRAELSVILLREVNKLHINGVCLQKQFSQISLFEVREKLCCRIISEIISVAKSLEEFLSIWVASLVVLGRLQGLTRDQNDLPQKLNFNDILLFESFNKFQKQTYTQFFSHNLPKILYHHANPEIFQNYQRALKYSQEHRKDFNHHLFHSTTNPVLNLNFTHNIKVEYRNLHDKFPIVFEFNSQAGREQQNWKSTQVKLGSAIARGEYKQALDYYQSTLVTNEEEQIEFNRLLDKAKAQGFASEHHLALYMFRELARKFNHQYDPLISLTPKILSKSQSSFEGQRQRRFNSFNKPSAERKQFVSEDITEKKSKGGFFGKPNSQSFSTSNKNDLQNDSEENKQAQKQHYEEYLRVAKETQQEVSKTEEIQSTNIFNFKQCTNFGDVTQQFEQNINKISKQNLAELLSDHKNIPVVENFSVLIKYYFLKRSNPNSNNPGGLEVSFNSSLGPIQKDYGEYLKGSYFPFAFTDRIYSEMLFDQTLKFNRLEFKKICAHILCYRDELPQEIVRQICDICSQQKIGITLLEIMRLVNEKRIRVSYESLKIISAAIQKYRNMESDLVQFLKGYSENTGISLEAALFEQYIANLTYSEQYEKLNQFLETLKFQLRAREYVINQQLTAEQNIEAEANHKKKQLARFTYENFVMLEIISQNFKPKTEVPNFIPEMYQVYMAQKKGQFNNKDLGIGMLLNGRNEEEFLNTLIKIKENPELNDDYVLSCGIRVLSVFSKRLKSHIQKVLNLTIYSKKAQLTNENIVTLGFVFKDIDMPNVFSEFLEYLLIIKLDLTPEIKSQYYKIFNAITDDYSKNQISGLLDFIFNPKREKQRDEFRAIKEEEEKKTKLLQQMNKGKVEKTAKTEEAGSPARPLKKEEKLSKKEKKKQKKDDKTDSSNTVTPNPKTTLEDIKLTYSPKLSSYHLRNRPLRIFLGTFMRRYEPIIEGQEIDIQKGKQGVKGVKIKGDKKRQ